MRLFILRRTTSQLLNKFKEGLKGSGVKIGNNLLQFCTYYKKARYYNRVAYFMEC
jgi:hypothetical protein